MSETSFPSQSQTQPGLETKMQPKPEAERASYRAAGKLQDNVAVITGGDSGIGRAVALAFAQEGAHLALCHVEKERSDAEETRRLVEKHGRRAVLIAGDIGDSRFCTEVVRLTLRELGRIDVVVNNAAEQHPREDLTEITDEQLERTFRTNLFAQFYLTRAALPHLKEGASVINTTSVTAYAGSPHLLDYSSTKGAIVSFTRSLAINLAKRGIRVNGVAPGPIWTPLIPATFRGEKVETFGQDTPLGRAGQPSEVAGCFVFLASEDASYMTGQVLHPNGGRIING